MGRILPPARGNQRGNQRGFFAQGHKSHGPSHAGSHARGRISTPAGRRLAPLTHLLEGFRMLQNATQVNNGVNVGALLDARQALTAAPEAARFKWRATTHWVNGTH